MKTRDLLRLGFALLLLGPAHAVADPMEGTPPDPKDQVTLKNWTAQPFSRWAFRNVSILPSVMVPRGGPIIEIPSGPPLSADALPFVYKGESLPVAAALAAEDTDGFIVIHHGKIVFERYYGGLDADDHHLWASSTKSLVAMALGILIEEGRVDPSKQVTDYLPELSGSGFGRATVRNLLNMSSALDFTEDYTNTDPESVSMQYFRRVGLFPAWDLAALDPASDPTPRGVLRFLPRIGAGDGEPGRVYQYQSPNVDVVGWIISRVSGKPLQEFVADRIWSRIGAEHDAFFGTDAEFVPIATGGFATTLRDAARFGLAILNEGRVGATEVLPKAWIQDTLAVTDADLQATAASTYRQPGSPSFDEDLTAYRNFFWIFDADRGEMSTRGVFGQYVYINRAADVVIASFSSAPSASNARRASFARKMRATRFVAEWLVRGSELTPPGDPSAAQ